MKYFFPLFSLYICSTYNAGFLHLLGYVQPHRLGQGIIINKTYEKKSQSKTTIVQEDSLK